MPAHESLALRICLLALVLAGCSASDQSAPPPHLGGPASLAELIGPWRREPLQLGPAVVAEATRVCRQDPEFPGPIPLVLIDARGDGRLLATFVGANVVAECFFLEVNATGSISGSMNSKGGPVTPLPPAGKLVVTGGFGSGQPGDAGGWSSFSGRAGPGVAHVVFEVPQVGSVVATVQNGWFTAWWPGALRDRVVVIAYDANGRQTDQVTP